MNKKILIIVGVVVVAAAIGFSVLNKSDSSNHAVTKTDEATGEALYTNLDYGFSIAYGKDWEGPAETKDKNAEKTDPLLINAVFRSTSTLEAVVIGGKPGDTESFNAAAASLDIPYRVVTVGGLPSLRYEYVAPINEEATAYAKIVMFVFKGLPKGSVTMAYQKLFSTEAEAKKADMSRLDTFLTRIKFN